MKKIELIKLVEIGYIPEEFKAFEDLGETPLSLLKTKILTLSGNLHFIEEKLNELIEAHNEGVGDE